MISKKCKPLLFLTMFSSVVLAQEIFSKKSLPQPVKPEKDSVVSVKEPFIRLVMENRQEMAYSQRELEEHPKFTAKLWSKHLYKKMLAHEFSKGLQKGTLSKKAFRHYLSQDILYLKDDLRAFENLAKRLKKGKQKSFFKQICKDLVELEKVFDKELLKKFNTKKAHKKSKVIKKYTSFLLKTSLHEQVFYIYCALLPCFWLYGKVGLSIYQKSVKNNPYADWIEFYKDEEFLTYTKKFIKIVEKSSKHLSKKELKNAKRFFIKSCKFELAFFDEAIKKGK